jgi:tetratricopeptide (TPR) repeat protein
VEFAEQARDEVHGQDAVAWLERIEQELDGLRDALRLLSERHRPVDVEKALRLAGGLRDFWWERNHLDEGRTWLTRLLALPEAHVRNSIRATALDDASVLAFYQGEHDVACALLQESISIWRELDEPEYAVYSLLHLATIFRLGQGDPAAAKAANNEGLTLARRLGFKRGVAYALSALGRVAIDEMDWSTAHSRLSEGMAMLRELEDVWAMSAVLGHFALLSAATGQPRRALRLASACAELQESLGMSRVPADKERIEAALATARMALSPSAAEGAWLAGRSMTLEEAVAEVLQPGNA